MAMLAKQGWRLIHNPNSPCAQILKAKYFPDSNLLKAKVRQGCSYTRRSILQGVEVLKNGVIWRIGNGQSVDIWTDPWLPRGVTRRPVSPRRHNILTRVHELIDPATEQWDVELLKQMFHEEDVRLIRSIPVHVDMEDAIGWHFDNKGCFSVLSAYKVHRATEVRKQQRTRPGGAEGSEGKDELWSKLWKIDCPPKIKHFLWRLSHNTLAVRRILQRRGMKIDTLLYCFI